MLPARRGAGLRPAYLAIPDTAHFYVDSATDGVSYTTASGRTYFTPASTGNPVPEPSTFWMAGTALATIVLARKRRA